MAEIAAAAVKGLRDKTGAGIMDCKRALAESGGDMEAATDWLRSKGLATAARKAGRVAADGLVGLAIAADGRSAAAIEVNAETDFVARNATFQAFVRHCAALALETGGDLEALAARPGPEGDGTIAGALTGLVATAGENVQLRRAGLLSVSKGAVAGYVHAAVSPGLGRIAVVVALESEAEGEKLTTLARQLAMHVAAAKPEAATIADLDPRRVERERSVLAEQARQSGKPEGIVQKMVEGRLRKFHQEVVLTEQVFVVDGETRIAGLLDQAGCDLGAPVKVAGFVRYGLGEGIEKKEDDFAAAVAAAAS